MMWRTAIILGAFILVISCAAPPKHKAYPVLEPMDPPGPPDKSEVARPNYDRLEAMLLGMGYEPVGMQFETDANLDLITQVFSSPIAQRRKIKLVYTGLQMAYDKAAESFTIGGLTNVTSILTYIQRNVPVNPNPVVPLTPGRPVAPSPTPTPKPNTNRVPIPSPATVAPTPTPMAPTLSPPPIFEEEELPIEE